MNFRGQHSLSASEKKGLFLLWNAEYPKQLGYATAPDLESYLATLENPYHVLLKDKNLRIVGWYFDFEREGKTWFAIILDSSLQGKGTGTQLLNRAKENHKELNGWVIDHNNDKKMNGETYLSPLEFYTKNDFKIVPSNRLELETISAVQITWTKHQST